MTETPAAEEQRSPQRGMCAAILSLEAVVLGLTTPVMINLSDVPWQTACLIGLGFVVPMMFVLGGIFALLWGTAYFLGRKIERERAEAYAAYEAERSA